MDEPEQAQPEAVPATENFRITDDNLGVGSLREKFRRNMDAINTLQAIELEGRTATPAEQEILSRYVGWGGLSQAFDENNGDWTNEFLELQAALTPEEYASARKSTFYILANTVQTQGGDGRVSQANKQWAQTVPVVFERGKRDMSYLITRTHPGVLNMFVSQARHEFLLKQPLKAADIKAEAEHILKRIQEAQEPNSPNGTHYMVQVSPDFLARAKSKDTDRLMSMLPFRSLSLSTLEGRKGTYALIRKDENRFQPLVLRRPSVKKKLQEKSAVSAAPSAPGKSKSKGQER